MRLGVTLFSFTREFWLGEWSLDECLAHAASLGEGQALELIGAQSLSGYPDVSDATVRAFRTRVDELGLVPTCYDAYHEPAPLLETELALAQRLGFPLLRLNTATPELIMRLLRSAERADVRIVVELHSKTIDSPEMQTLLELFERLDSPHVGFLQDLGAIMVRVPESFRRAAPVAGDVIADSWDAGETLEQTLARVDGPVASTWAHMAHAMFRRAAPETLDAVIPWLAHVHAKFFGIINGEEPAIPYADILRRLARYDGALVSEYAALAANGNDSLAEVRAHQAMLRRLACG
jgi:sugar phosphate isomerase/epimerase